MFDAYLQELLVTSEERLIADLPLEAPCWLFNALFCIAHAQVHFLEEDGIMLKHVLDWIQIRKDSKASLFREQFDEDIDRFELRKFFECQQRGRSDSTWPIQQVGKSHHHS